MNINKLTPSQLSNFCIDSSPQRLHTKGRNYVVTGRGSRNAAVGAASLTYGTASWVRRGRWRHVASVDTRIGSRRQTQHADTMRGLDTCIMTRIHRNSRTSIHQPPANTSPSFLSPSSQHSRPALSFVFHLQLSFPLVLLNTMFSENCKRYFCFVFILAFSLGSQKGERWSTGIERPPLETQSRPKMFEPQCHRLTSGRAFSH